MFVLSKIAAVVLAPLNALLLGLAVAAALLGTRWDRAARRALRVLVAAAAVLGAAPVGDLLVGILEERFPAPPLPARADGVVVLGGGLDAATTRARGQPALTGAAERLTALAALARRYPDATLVYAGGNGSLDRSLPAEADEVPRLLADLGVAPARVRFEGGSRNTHENAVEARRVARPGPGQVWLLVTSAMHMPRAMGAFRAAGWEVLPWPVDYQTGGGRLPVHADAAEGLARLGGALHEVAGLVAYRAAGRSSALWPAP